MIEIEYIVVETKFSLEARRVSNLVVEGGD